MADLSLHTSHRAPRGHGPSAEYRIYFAVIFLASVPFALAKWTVGLARTGRSHNPGVIDRALSEARAITPMIFSA